MVYDKISFIQGVIIDNTKLITLFEKDPKFKAKWKQYYKDQNNNSNIKQTNKDQKIDTLTWSDLCDYFGNIEIIEDFNDIYMKTDLKIHRYKCCSPLANKYYIVGKNINTYVISDINEKIIEAPTMPYDKSLEKELTDFLEISIDKENLKMFLMLDDCAYCT